MQGKGLLSVLAPVLGLGAALAAPEVLPALGAGEAAGGAAEAAPFLIPGTDTALAGAETIPLGTLDTTGGLLGAGAAGAEAGAPAVAGQVAELGAGPNLLGADAGGIASTAPAAPGLADTAAVTPAGPIGNIAATSAAPTVPGAGLPPGLDNPISPDLTLAQGADPYALTGPPPGATVQMNPITSAAPTNLAPGYPGDTSVTAPTATSVGGAFSPVATPADIAAGFPGGTTGAAESLGFGATADQSGAGIGNIAGDVGKWAAAHPGALLTAGIAGGELLKGNPQYPAAQSLQGLATPAGTAGYGAIGTGIAGLQGQAATTAGETAALTAPLTTGILPPGLQQTVDQAVQAQKAQVRSTYATQGLTGSTMEATALSQVDANAAAQKAGLAEGLLQPAAQFSQQTNQAFNAISGVGAALTGQSLQAYNELVRSQMLSDQNYQAALYKFAAALAGSGYQPPTANA